MVLASLSATEHDEILPYLEEVQVNRGEYLFRPGDPADAVFFLKSGKVGVQTSTGFEDRMQVVALLDPGAAVGEKGLVTTGSREMTVVAIEDSVLYSLGEGAFTKLEKSNPDLALKILKKLLKVSSLRLRSSSERLAHVL
jgi:CRP/FNR family transcriptional regulator, cyclic AMP receptor protein